LLRTRKFSKKNQYLISLSLVLITVGISYFFSDILGYRTVALLLMLAVSLNAILFDIYPVMVSAVVSGLVWNFFFIPPTLTFQIGKAEDALLFLMYFVIASINAILTFKIREFERKQAEELEKEKAIQLYNTLLNSLSHELRTPISAVIAAIDILQDQEAKLTQDQRKELYGEIELAGIRLNRQVENLLSMSRLEAGFVQPKLDWCDLNELVLAAIQSSKEKESTYQIEFRPVEGLPFCKLDSGLVDQIIQNLLHNAQQHTPDGSLIQIQVDSDPTSVSIVVSDNGSGFPENEMVMVFDKFYRLKNAIPGGTGLGLSIVKGLAEAMGGTIYLENQDNSGARFTLVLPCDFLPKHSVEDE
jgi:two-component system sensor histidine kinase KdpD